MLDARDLPFADATFDVVVDKATLDACDCTDSGSEPVCVEYDRVLGDGGHLVVVTCRPPRRRLESLAKCRMVVVSCEPLRTPAEEASRAPGGATLIVLTKRGREHELDARCKVGGGAASGEVSTHTAGEAADEAADEAAGEAAGDATRLLDVSLLDRMDAEALARFEEEAKARRALKENGNGEDESDEGRSSTEDEGGMGLGGMFGFDPGDSESDG